ncbi:MAG: quinoprotein glucose dehydrogenase [Rhodothermales bacterium]|jgi:quinoprotein glucose dehydrogenase
MKWYLNIVAALTCIASVYAGNVPDGYTAVLWADDTQLGNPVCLAIDEQGRVYIGETYRQNQGVEDFNSMKKKGVQIVADDLAFQSTEERLDFLKRHADKVPMSVYSKYEDRIIRLADTDADGKADQKTIFSDGYNEPLHGTGAGLIARAGSIYYTCIPDLYLLKDADDDGVADAKTVLQSGFGVRHSYRGHDMHGLAWGPDGKLYWSIGDRGYSFTTKEGRRFHSPGSGAVLRCNPDGSDLDVFYHGLRNPQELAFDQYGNLLTGDNNSDAGDKARILYLAEAGETGWNMSFQFDWRRDLRRGPWHLDKRWHLQNEAQSAWILPPIDHYTSGPCGLSYYPGIGMGERYQAHFFLCDFRGGAGNSAVRSFALEPDGAGFKVVDKHDFFSKCLVTDVDFGYDGKMYVSDWIGGWGGTGKGKIHAIYHNEQVNSAAVREVTSAFGAGIETQSSEQLAAWLAHGDMRLRLRSQFALAERGAASAALFVDAFTQTENQLARLHGIWGLGQLGRQSPELLQPALALLGDADAEVAAQAAKVIGDAKFAAAEAGLLGQLQHPSSRVKYFAAMALGKLQSRAAMPKVLAILEANQGKDVFLRHGCIMYLVWTGDKAAVRALASHTSVEVRVAAVIALRRWQDPFVAEFLTDADERVVTEAARAIHDEFLDEATPTLASALTGPVRNERFLYRAINANFRLGTAKAASRLAAYAADEGNVAKMRSEALQALIEWEAKSPRDRILGEHHPLGTRDTASLQLAVGRQLESLMKAGGDIQKKAIDLLKRYKLEAKAADPATLAADSSLPIANRIAAIELLDQTAAAVLKTLTLDPDPQIRGHAARTLAAVDTAAGLDALKTALAGGQIIEQQLAFASLRTIPGPTSASIVNKWMKRLISGQAPPALQLDILEAAKALKLSDRIARYETGLSASDPLATYRVALAGGNPARGEAIFESHQSAQCQRCHKAGAGPGGDVGPNLASLGERQTPLHLLESIVIPSAQIAPGFEMSILTLADGTVHAGTIISETGGKITIASSTGENTRIDATAVVSRDSQKISAMPPLGQVLTAVELRDLLAYLQGL